MRILIAICLVLIAVSACNTAVLPLSPKEQLLVGQWRTADQRQNHDKFVFNADRTFGDFAFESHEVKGPVRAESWLINGNHLNLVYKVNSGIVPYSYKPYFNIIFLNDSALVLAIPPYKQAPAIRVAFKKVKDAPHLLGQ